MSNYKIPTYIKVHPFRITILEIDEIYYMGIVDDFGFLVERSTLDYTHEYSTEEWANVDGKEQLI